MDNSILVDALDPIFSRVVTSHCWVKREGKLSHTRRPLTRDKLSHHVNGGPYYGAAQIAPGATTTRVALLDLDSHGGETAWGDMQAAALTIVSGLERNGLRPVPFRSSGGAGIHLYLLWDTQQDAYSVRCALRAALEQCGLADGTKGLAAGEVEVFPKQNGVPSDGFGNMFVLPLAGKSVPLDPYELEDMPKEFAAEMEWPVSSPVPVIERDAAPALTTSEVPVELEQLKSALDSIPNALERELDYDAWRDVVFGIHHATQGSDVGLALAHEFSGRSSKYDPKFLDERVWPHIGKSAERAPVTGRTVLHVARQHGWQEPIEDDFEPIFMQSADARPPLPRFRRNDHGEILACIENVVLALSDAQVCGVQIRFDAFRAEVMLATRGTEEWRTLTDADYTRLQIHLESNSFKKLSKEMMRDAVWLVADDNRFDSAIKWIGTLEHDGVSRIETFLPRYLGTSDTAYTRAVSRYIWTALAGRVLDPGCEAPMAPVFIGAQGAGKTRAVKALAPALDFYAELNLAERDAEASRRMRGRLVIELGELRGLHSRDSESIKAFISRTHEEWRTLYKEFATTFARRFLFFGTTNQDEFLDDDTGERRWLPVRVGHCDVVAIEADCLQLWAEARDAYELAGIEWREAETLARGVHAEHKIADAWLPIVEGWLAAPDEFAENSTPPGTREFLQVHEVASAALGLDVKNLGKREEMRIGKCLQVLGYRKADKWLGGRSRKVWLSPPTPPLAT
jgi:predicted P-loop ATPase